jgi:hypothetical protein
MGSGESWIRPMSTTWRPGTRTPGCACARPGLYLALAGSGTTHLTLEVPLGNEFLPGGARENEHRLIEFSAEIFMTDGATIEVDPIIVERPT